MKKFSGRVFRLEGRRLSEVLSRSKKGDAILLFEAEWGACTGYQPHPEGVIITFRNGLMKMNGSGPVRDSDLREPETNPACTVDVTGHHLLYHHEKIYEGPRGGEKHHPNGWLIRDFGKFYLIVGKPNQLRPPSFLDGMQSLFLRRSP